MQIFDKHLMQSFHLSNVIFFVAALAVEGETLWLSKLTRSEMGAYLCIGECHRVCQLIEKLKFIDQIFLPKSIKWCSTFGEQKDEAASSLWVNIKFAKWICKYRELEQSHI